MHIIYSCKSCVLYSSSYVLCIKMRIFFPQFKVLYECDKKKSQKINATLNFCVEVKLYNMKIVQ